MAFGTIRACDDQSGVSNCFGPAASYSKGWFRMAHLEALAPSGGLRVVLDLENGLELEDLRERVRTYAISAVYDGSLKIFRRHVGVALVLEKADHRAAVLAWLRQWGCRGLDLASEATSAEALLTWG